MKVLIILGLIAAASGQLFPSNLGAGNASSTSGPQSQSAVGGAASGNATEAAVTTFLHTALSGQVLGLKKCKKPKDCTLGFRCDLLLNLCVPFTTPIMTDIEKPCLNDTECSGLHRCQGGFCRFCGPKSCRSNMDCCAGSFAQAGQPASFYECLDLEKLEKQSLAAQLGRPVMVGHGGKSPIDSEELTQLGISPIIGDQIMYGKRCWARCNADTDCYNARTPENVKKNLGCCNGVCTRRASCVTVPQAAIQMQQQIQQQAMLQQQAMQQQQMMLQQQQQQLQQQPQAGGWGTHGHSLQQPQLGTPQLGLWQQQQQQMPQQQRAPLSWAEAQMSANAMPQAGQQQNQQQSQQQTTSRP